MNGSFAGMNRRSGGLEHGALVDDKIWDTCVFHPNNKSFAFPGWALPSWPVWHSCFMTHSGDTSLSFILLWVSGPSFWPGLLWSPLPLRSHRWVPASTLSPTHRSPLTDHPGQLTHHPASACLSFTSRAYSVWNHKYSSKLIILTGINLKEALIFKTRES